MRSNATPDDHHDDGPAGAPRAPRGPFGRGEGGVLTRRRFLTAMGAASAGLAGLAGDAFAVEPNLVHVSRHVIGPGPDGPVLRMVQVSDLHLRGVGHHEARIADQVRALAPSMLLVTGDSIDRAEHLETLAEFLTLLDDATPKYAVLGNWEYYARVDRSRLARVYDRHNCRLLVNESVVHRYAGHEVLVTGVDDLLAGQPRLAAALQGHEPHGHHILLAHCPLQRDHLLGVLPARPWMNAPPLPEPGAERLAHFAPKLVFSGHTHGGQVNLFGYCPWLPWGSGPYISGWYTDREPHLYVSRGLGTVVLPARWGASPELPCFDWHLRPLAADGALATGGPRA
jgi:predicted MPP superfamily phosphohydrolase